MNVKDELLNLIKDGAEEVGRDLGDDLEAVAVYAEQRSAHLATITAEPGFERAVRAERDSVALKAGINVTDTATTADQRLVGLIHGGIRIAAMAIAG